MNNSNNSLRLSDGEQLYVCFDTCTIIDCAYARSEKANPTVLDRVFSSMDKRGAKLLMPEVVLLELELVGRKHEEEAKQALNRIASEVNGLADGGVLHGDNLDGLKKSVEETKRKITEDANRVIDSIRSRAKDDSRSIILNFGDSEIHEAIRMALAGTKPSKRKVGYGLLQGDCLIIACLKTFLKKNPSALLVFCSSNTSDFASKSSDGSRVVLDSQISEYLGDSIEYCSEPVSLLASCLAQDLSEAEEEEIDKAYERSVLAGKRLDDVAATLNSTINYEEVANNMLAAFAKSEGSLQRIAQFGQSQLLLDSLRAFADVTQKSIDTQRMLGTLYNSTALRDAANQLADVSRLLMISATSSDNIPDRMSVQSYQFGESDNSSVGRTSDLTMNSYEEGSGEGVDEKDADE